MASTSKSIVTRLADAGEDAIQRLGGAPGGDRLVGVLNGLRERVDDMQKRMRALADVEKRLDAVERRLDKVEGKSSATRKSSSSGGGSASTSKKSSSS
jgi:hypothetical protein